MIRMNRDEKEEMLKTVMKKIFIADTNQGAVLDRLFINKKAGIAGFCLLLRGVVIPTAARRITCRAGPAAFSFCHIHYVLSTKLTS